MDIIRAVVLIKNQFLNQQNEYNSSIGGKQNKLNSNKTKTIKKLSLGINNIIWFKSLTLDKMIP